MQKFNIGDKIREISTGDEGTIVEHNVYSNQGDNVNVHWCSGWDKGCTLYVSKSEIELLQSTEITFEQAIQALLQSGYKVTLEKI